MGTRAGATGGDDRGHVPEVRVPKRVYRRYASPGVSPLGRGPAWHAFGCKS